jgi:hypothetical protein
MQIGDGGGGGPVWIDHHELRATVFPRAGDVGHDVDLGGHGVAAPHHDQIRFRHLPRVDAAALSHAGDPAELRQRGADRQLLSRVAHDVAQPVDPVALHESHGAGIKEWPHRFAAKPRRGLREHAGDPVQCFIPGDAFELSRTPWPGAQQGVSQTIGMVDAFGVTADLGADHSGCVTVVRGAVHSADARAVQHLHRQGAG